MEVLVNYCDAVKRFWHSVTYLVFFAASSCPDAVRGPITEYIQRKDALTISALPKISLLIEGGSLDPVCEGVMYP